MLYDLIQNEGLSLGTSCGVNIAGAIRLGKKLGPGKTIVTILCDRSDKYNSKLFNKKFWGKKVFRFPLSLIFFHSLINLLHNKNIVVK